MSEIQNIKEVIKSLKDRGVVSGNGEIAAKMGYKRVGTISDNLKKEPLDDKFLSLFCTTFNIPIGKIRSAVTSANTIHSLPSSKKPNQVPFHQDVTLTGGAVEVYNGKSYSPILINLGDAFNDATGAMQVSGHSMYPNYESGCIVGYREVKDKTYFIPGEVYIIGTEDYQMLKRVQKSEEGGRIMLISDNDEPGKHGRPKYEPFELEIDKIRFMAIVLGKISRTQMKLMLSNS